MWLQKPVPQMFGPVAQIGAERGDHPTMSKGTATPTPTYSTSDAPGFQAETTDSISSLPQLSPFAFTPTNFMRLVKRVDQHEKQMKYLLSG